jgi:hypothetical protein
LLVGEPLYFFDDFVGAHECNLPDAEDQSKPEIEINHEERPRQKNGGTDYRPPESVTT